MKKLLPILTLLCCSCFAQTLVQSNSNKVAGGSAGTVATSLTSISAHHFVFAAYFGCSSRDSGCKAASISAPGETLTACPMSEDVNNNGQAICMYTCDSAAGTVTFTGTESGAGSTDGHIFAAEYSGVATTACEDAEGSGTSASASPSVTTSTSVSQSNELVLGLVGDWVNNHTATAGSGFTIVRQSNNTSSGDMAALEALNATTGLSGTQTASWGSLGTDTKVLLVATFLGAGGGAPTVTCTLALMGVGPC